ncbi:hypothetical protein WKI65_43250 [Streptomyces sp. MS1.AVA.3]|uniref:hypothetical protein n=1 Tax=Streptomyces decoyicus TaxID=249567 RepID=UPI0030BF0A76
MAATDTAHLTGAQLIEHEHTELRIAYAVKQLKEGKYLSITNGPDGKVASTCGHDPREDRDWFLGLVERSVRP